MNKCSRYLFTIVIRLLSLAAKARRMSHIIKRLGNVDKLFYVEISFVPLLLISLLFNQRTELTERISIKLRINHLSSILGFQITRGAW